MAGKTNELISMSKSLSKNFVKRELDVLLSTENKFHVLLFQSFKNNIGVKAKSFMNWQIPILTEGEHANSRIINVSKTAIDNYLSKGGVAVVPGFQEFQAKAR